MEGRNADVHLHHFLDCIESWSMAFPLTRQRKGLPDLAGLLGSTRAMREIPDPLARARAGCCCSVKSVNQPLLAGARRRPRRSAGPVFLAERLRGCPRIRRKVFTSSRFMRENFDPEAACFYVVRDARSKRSEH